MDAGKLMTMMNEGDWESALAYCDQTIEVEPMSSSAWLNRGYVLHEIVGQNCRIFLTGSFAWLVVLFDRSGKLPPDARDRVRGLIGRDYASRLGKLLDEAGRSFDKAVELDPESSNAYLWRGILRRDSGCFEQARADLERALELAKPDSRQNVQAYLNDIQNFDWNKVASAAMADRIIFYPVESAYGEKVSRILKTFSPAQHHLP